MEMEKGKQLAVNMFAGLFALATSIGINFFLSPYIVEAVGAEAYGFVQLSNQLISYFGVVTIALNSMSSRFISVSYFRGDIAAAREYYGSTFFSNVALCLLFLPVFAWGIFHIAEFLNISGSLVLDVQALMGLMAANFLIGLLSTNLGVSFYIRNKLYLSSAVSMAANVLRAALLLALFTQLEPHVAYMGAVAVAVTLFTQAYSLYYKKRLIPELEIKWRYFSTGKVRQLLSAGIWNTVTRAGVLLQEGLDLLIANLLISPEDMGVLAIAKTVPTAINSVLNTMIGAFMPSLTEFYAKGEREELRLDVKRSMKIIGMVINIPIGLLIGFGDVLFGLWFPTQDAGLLQALSVLTIFPWVVMGPATILHNIFTVVNKIKAASLLICLTGVLNVAVVYALLKGTSLGLFAVAGVSVFFSIGRNLLYTVPFGAACIGCPWHTFFPEIGKSVLSVAMVSGVSLMIKGFMAAPSWGGLCLASALAGAAGLGMNCFIVLDKEDRGFLLRKIRR